MNIGVLNISIEEMYRAECRDTRHILDMMRDGGELRIVDGLGGAYLKMDDEEFGLEWTFIPSKTLRGMDKDINRVGDSYVLG